MMVIGFKAGADSMTRACFFPPSALLRSLERLIFFLLPSVLGEGEGEFFARYNNSGDPGNAPINGG